MNSPTTLQLRPFELPDRLASTCAELLPVAGAGLSLFGNQSEVPIGASDDVAGYAQRLQFTLGQGPCHQAHSQSHPVRASAPDMRQRWPRLARELSEHTPYRSIVSLPLPHLGGGWSGALDLYLDHPTKAYVLPLAEARVRADAIAAELSVADDRAAVVGADGLTPERRMRIWVAVGTVAVQLGISCDRAGALLREHAPAEPLEEVAERITNGTLTSVDLSSGNHSGADLSGVDLSGIDLSGVDLSSAV